MNEEEDCFVSDGERDYAGVFNHTPNMQTVAF